MASGEDWLFRPVLEGLCRFESLNDGTLSLADIADLNEALDVRAENEWRLARTKEK
ncbi:hypothetical protein [Telmatospirillum sp. J64-1]|uniref:DUF6889 family protein n=1 Tax=Telmatospirillum sp. J64-1 TaxID=2502183 RepID=UPI00163D65AA|nr:hypothetical protein [Telmatospirillum sp. J64-1]